MPLFGPKNYEDIKQLEKNKDVRRLVKALNNNKAEIRGYATSALGRLADVGAIVPLLKLAAIERDRWVLWHITSALEKIGEVDHSIVNPAIFNIVVDALTTIKGKTQGGSDVPLASADLLVNAAAPDKVRAVQVLTSILQNRNQRNVWIVVLRALGKLKASQAVEAIIPILLDGDVKISITAAETLGELGDHRAIQPLAKLNAQSSGELFLVTAVALARLDFLDATEIIIPLLKDNRVTAPLALGKYGDARAVQPLLRCLTEIVKDNEESFQGMKAKCCIEALTQLLRRTATTLSDIDLKTLTHLEDVYLSWEQPMPPEGEMGFMYETYHCNEIRLLAQQEIQRRKNRASSQDEKFTEAARLTAQHAAEVVRRYGKNQIDTEHVLLALIEKPLETTPQILKILNTNPETLIGQLDDVIRRSSNASIPGDPPQISISPRVNRIIDLAYREAQQLNDKLISTEHILLSNATDGNTPAAHILETAGLDRSHVYAAIMQLRT